MMRDNLKFENGLKELGIVLSQDQISQFQRFYDILLEWNKVMNLTAITDYQEVITKHFLDSLSIVKALREEGDNTTFSSDYFNGVKMLDLGTGAGFPGIPLKIAFPELEVLLVDSLNKRINFLNEVITALKLNKVTALHGRAEELGRKKEYREKYDISVSRAVARLYLLSEYCLPFVHCGGSFISYKSGKAAEEISEARYAFEKLGGKYKKTTAFFLPDSDIERNLIVVKKVKETPTVYPRSFGKITRNPLLQ